MKISAISVVVRVSFMVDVTVITNKKCFPELCRIVEETIELYKRDRQAITFTDIR